ncbi:hypothetical protein [Streptomyces sp. NPDC126514]|uniref:hypothetical protein n=1 Tax=Streptomyces sp. NPDC126514 TaxID=3155210 RepID=UPI003332245F
MSFVRRIAALSFAVVALLVGGLASSAAAAPAAPTEPTVSAVPVDGPFGGHGGGHRPIRFGPFEFPSNGQVSAGFAWDTNNGGGIGF